MNKPDKKEYSLHEPIQLTLRDEGYYKAAEYVDKLEEYIEYLEKELNKCSCKYERNNYE